MHRTRLRRILAAALAAFVLSAGAVGAAEKADHSERSLPDVLATISAWEEAVATSGAESAGALSPDLITGAESQIASAIRAVEQVVEKARARHATIHVPHHHS